MSERETFDGVGGEEGQIACLERIVICEIRRPALWLRLSRQRRVVHLQCHAQRNTDVGLYATGVGFW